MSKYYLHLFSLIFIITSCGGGGGGSSEPPVPAPTVSISLSSSSIVLGESVTINWSSSNASSCTANGSWSGSKATSGTETLTPSGVGFFNYGISCSGSGGSRSSSVGLEVYRQTEGVSVDGYIRGAEIFIDKNNNFIADIGDENSTSSDNEGKFTIKYDDGNLISLGGIDLDTGNPLDNFLINQNLSGYSEFKVITPVTSLASFLNDSTSINNVLGIDSSIDVFTFDPVANKGDGGINDYLYEKGNQLTVLAFSLQNIINNINSTTETTQDYFKSIAEEIDVEYAATSQKVDIETSNFVLNVLNNITTAKEVTLDEANKDNTVTALSGLLPIIEVKPSQDLTNSIFNFSTTTLQTDILTIADGTASEEVLSNYTTNIIEYIAQDQNIDSDEITPDITAIGDSAETEEDASVTINVIANDSYISTAPISVSATNGSNGTTVLAETSPEQVVYTPNPDFNGSDSFSYTITQGDKTSSADVSLTISPVQDDPVINISSSISTPENVLSVTTISISDVDDDELTLTLSGTDADAFNLSSANELSFKELPDYEDKQQYALTLSLTDGNTTVTKDITIIVTNVNDVSPVITSLATFSAAENQTAIGSVEASDAEGDDLTYAVSGSEISISSSGVLSFIAAPDYESKTIYTTSVTVSDGVNSVSQDITVNITNVNDVAPVISSSATFSAAENQTAIGLVEASDVEGDDLTFSISGNEITISSSGVLTFISAPDYESKTAYTATITVSDGELSDSQDITVNITNVNDVPPVISSGATFSAAENQTAIGSVSASDAEGDDLTYAVSGSEISISSSGVLSFIAAPDYESKTIYTTSVTVSDGVNSVSQDITVNITNVNDVAPVISSSATFSAAENQTAIGSVSASDAEGDDLTYAVSGDEISISNSGVLAFKNAPDYESKSTYTETVTVSDGVNSSTQDITVNITNVNDVAPVISSSSTFSAAENQTAIGSVEASDVEGDDLTYSISGTEISISSTGVLSFISAPDYESKTSYSATVTVSDGELIDTQDLIVSVINVNDNSPVITSGSGFSVNENVSTIGTVQASDADNDALAYSVTGSELQISNSGVLSFSDSNGADFESQSSYIAEVSVFDGVFTVSQTIIITVNDTNDNTPIITTSSLTPNENLVIIGSVSASDGDADSTLSFSISGADTLKDDRIFLEIDSNSGEISIASGRGVLDYETKSSYTINVTVSDGENSSTSPVTIDVQNILEDLIDYTFSISDGTAAVSPVLSVNATFDELTFINGGSAYVALFSTALTPIGEQFGNPIYPACAGALGIYEMTSNDNRTSWSLTETLSDELSDLCTYFIEILINTNNVTSDTSPPTDSIHRQTGNNRYGNKPIQFEMHQWFDGMGLSLFGSDDLAVLYSNAVTIANPIADNIIDTLDAEDGGGSLFLYSEDTYPSECSVNSYNVTITDALGFSETLTTPQVAQITADCLNAMAFNNISSVGGKFNFSFDVYSIEPMSLFKGYMYMPYKTNQGDTGNGGLSSPELLYNNGTIRGDDNRIANLSFEFDREAAPSGDLDSVINTDGILYFEAIDESSLRIGYYSSGYEMNIPQVNGDADETAPLVNSISTSSFTDSNYPQRNFVKFEVDVTNNASSNGTITPIKDIWISITGGPYCANRVVYVRDELDGKLDTSTSLFTATVPFLKSDEGTYMIDGYNINDHGYAESYYGGSVNHIGDTFTVGNDIDQTCPLFTQNYGSGSITVDVEENTKTIGTFPATGPSADTITYSLVAVDSGSGSIIDLVTINSSTGELSYKDSPDYEGDITYSGSVGIKAQYYSTLSRQLNVTVNLINLNDNPPVFTSSATLSADENQTAIGCVSVTDADAVANAPELGKCATTNGITFTVTGDNLEISEDGRLSFTSAPDYETKSSYTGTVTASDGVFSTTQDITVNINDLNDNDPIVTSNTTFTVSENQTGVGQITVSDGDANSSFTFAIVSDYEDGALFNVDSDGVITFKANANHETAGQYTIKVNISDGVNTVAQIFTINLTDVCEFDFNDVVYSGLVLENQEASTRPLTNDTINSKFFYEFNIDTTDDACNVPSDETYSFSLTGDDASAFTLESSTGNDTDKNFIYLNKIFDHENPTDLNSDNVYNVTLNVTLDDFTESKNLSLTVSDGYEFGEIQSYTFDESASKFTINYLIDDLPPNTSKLKFSIRGPSFTGGSNFLTETIDYDPGSSLYTIELDAAAKVQEIWPDDPTIYGGYYSVYKIEALDADGNLVLDDTNASIVNSNIIGPRHLYYERADGQNFTKLESISGNLAFDEETNSAIFTALTNTSNNNLQLPDTEDYNRLTNSTYINVRLEVSNDIVRSRGYGTTLAYDGQTQLPDENGDTTHTLYFSPNLKSGTHKYRIYIRNRGLDDSSFYTYIYWSELQTLGYVTNPISYTNPNGTDDIEGPRLTAVNAQPKDGSMTCSWNPDDDSTPEGPGRLTLENISSQIQFTDDSMSSADGQTATDADARVSYRIFNTSGDSVDSLSLTDDGNSQVDGNTKTMTLVDSSERFNIDASDSAQFILKPVSLTIYDAAGQRTQYYDGDSYVDVKYPSVSSIFENIDLRDYCNFNLGNNAPVFDTASAFTINEGETDITTLSASDADGDSVSYGKTSDGDSSYFTVNQTTGALSFTNAPDYENPTDSDTDNDYSVTVTATDGFNTTSQAISVTVADISDSPPTFTSSGSFTANENQTAIGTVVASDPDGDTVAYSLSGTDADSLEINSSTGVLTFKIAPDYETKSSYSAEAIASDGTNASAQTISITIVNVNEFTPTFTSSSSFTVAENQTTGPTITASDGDGDTLTYSISGGADASSFEINSSSGAITFKTAPDYETKSSYQLSVRASDGTNIAAQDITVNIGNLNEHAPSLSLNSPVSVNEGSTAVTTATATDADGDETITFSIFDTGNSCTDNDLFSIGESTGVITFKSAPDYENPADSDADNEYALCIKASDNGGAAGTYFEETSRGGAATLIVNVQDLDDTSPVFTSSGTFSVDENQTSIGTVTATDEDSDTLTYSISDGDTELSINSSSGVLIFNSAPNYEVKPRYPPTGSSGEAYEVTVSDGTNSTTQEIVININDVNDAPTFTSDSSFSIQENTTSAIGSVVASDEDSDDITFSISGSEINISSDGLLTFETAPDYETKTSYSATVSISDGTDTATQDITVNITDENERPTFTSSSTFSAAENQTSIGTVTATDPEGESVRFSLSSDTGLSITSGGVLTFESTPDYETKDTYTATVFANDPAENTKSQSITVNVTDVNEAPTFTSSASFSANENQTAIGTVEATDVDGDTLTYSISGSDITINSATGVISFVSAPDYETTTSYSATVTVSDGSNTDTQDISVSVINVNDNSPVVTSNATFTAPENQTAIGTVTATDADGDSLTFSSSFDADDILINSTTGVLTFTTAPDYEPVGIIYGGSVFVSDGDNTTQQSISITLTDVNDPPVFTSTTDSSGNLVFSADENQRSIGTVTATDQDGDSLTFTITDGAGEMQITNSGVLSFNETEVPDYETRTVYGGDNDPTGAGYRVQVSDGQTTAQKRIVVSINNLNDNSPVITSSSTFTADENQTSIGAVTATDADGDTLIFSSSDTNIPINSSSGVLSFATAPDFEVQNTYTVTITASDGIPGRAGTNSTTQEITITINDLDD